MDTPNDFGILDWARMSTRPGKNPWPERKSGECYSVPIRTLFAYAVILWIAVGTQSRATEGNTAPTNHWAFEPIRTVTPPPDSRPSHNPIDRFIHARLARHNLNPAPPADRRILIRRASFDLLGLPPTPEEVDAFVTDPSPDAYARLIDRLLASPHYGERWGRWWLDVARYADTNGQDENKVMSNAWRYRDWVIRAFNLDQPFDQFATDQLAGDLLATNGVPERVLFDRWTATGFLVLGPKMLAEQDKPKLEMDIVDEQIDVVSRAFLGLTVSCARCHDHKFDPIPTRDYYALAGIFKSTRTMENLAFVSKFNERRIATQDELAAIESSNRALAAKTNEIAAAIQSANDFLIEERRERLHEWLLTQQSASALPNTPAAGSTNVLMQLSALASLDPATNLPSRTLRRLAETPGLLREFLQTPEEKDPASFRLVPGKVGAAFFATGTNYLEMSHSPALDPEQLTVEVWVWAEEFPSGGDARRWLINKNGNEWVQGHYALVLDRNRAGAYMNIGGGQTNTFFVRADGPALKTNQWHHLAVSYDGTDLRLYVDGAESGHTVIGRARVPGNLPLALGRRQDGFVSFKGRLDEARVYSRPLSSAEIKLHYEQPDHAAGEGAVARWEFNALSEAEQRALDWAQLRETLFSRGGILALPTDPRPFYPATTRSRIAELERERDQLKAQAPTPPAYTLAVAENRTVDLPVHLRGSHLNLAREPVPRGFVQVVHRGSAELPREQSGRLELARWITSPENPLTARVIVNRVWQAHFGEGLVRTSDNFGIRGESPTHPELLDWLAAEFQHNGWSVKTLHRLILNSTTWQQAAIGPATDSDPENRLLSRFPRKRLEAEMIRDALLSVSGRLDLSIGGSLVQWKNDEYVPRSQEAAESVRRSVYLPIVRDLVYDVFSIFDFANPSVGVAKRTPTVVSHQALFFLNSPLVKASARSLATTLLASPEDSDADRICRAYQSTLNRPPNSEEVSRALRFIERMGGRNEHAPALSTWSSFCQALLASNEFSYCD